MAKIKGNLKDYFLTIHKIISRALTVSIDEIQRAIKDGYSGEENRQGFFAYIRMIALMLDAHHKTEDEIAFPYFEAKLPETHFMWLHEDHDLITGFLEELNPIMDALEMDHNTNAELIKLQALLLKIEDRWSQHIELEEEEFVTLIDSLALYEERERLIEQFFDYNQPLTQPYSLSLPFMLFNLEDEDREWWSGGYPEEMLQMVDSDAWKAQWSPMRPFLLN